MTAHAPASEHEPAHPTPGTYAKIGLVLFVLTALEVGLYELTYGEHAGSAGAAAWSRSSSRCCWPSRR